jgi:predicted dithiol-disulfide oxidoreductase (DUF899 family)
MSGMESAFGALQKEYDGAVARLAPLRRASALGVVEDFELRDRSGPVRLSSLFGDRRDLIVIQNMGRKCPYCTMWADGFNGLLPHLESRAAFVVVSPDAPDVQDEVKRERGWRFRLVSSAGSRFKEAMGFARDGYQTPGAQAFRRDDGGAIRNVANDLFGPGDPYCGAWHFFDLLEGGAGEWQPKLKY